MSSEKSNTTGVIPDTHKSQSPESMTWVDNMCPRQAPGEQEQTDVIRRPVASIDHKLVQNFFN